MPTLVILRHAEAVPSRTDDHARMLTAEGRADAASSGARVLGCCPGPFLVLASDARRTVETAELAFAAAAPIPEIRKIAALYNASAATLLDTVRGSGTNGTVVVVGHNPGLSEFAKELVLDGTAAHRERVEAGLPTAGVAVYAFDEPWTEIDKHQGRLTNAFAPDGKPWAG